MRLLPLSIVALLIILCDFFSAQGQVEHQPNSNVFSVGFFNSINTSTYPF